MDDFHRFGGKAVFVHVVIKPLNGTGIQGFQPDRFQGGGSRQKQKGLGAAQPSCKSYFFNEIWNMGVVQYAQPTPYLDRYLYPAM